MMSVASWKAGTSGPRLVAPARSAASRPKAFRAKVVASAAANGHGAPRPALAGRGGRLSPILADSVAGAAMGLFQLSHDGVEVEGRRLLARRVLLEVGDLLRHDRLHPINDVGVRDQPIPVGVR